MASSNELTELLDICDGPPGWRADIERLIAAERQRAAAEARIDEAKQWNLIAHHRDIGQVTHDYNVELRDRRIDELEAELAALQGGKQQ